MNDKKIEELLTEFFNMVGPVGLFVIIIYLFEEMLRLIGSILYDKTIGRIMSKHGR